MHTYNTDILNIYTSCYMHVMYILTYICVSKKYLHGDLQKLVEEGRSQTVGLRSWSCAQSAGADAEALPRGGHCRAAPPPPPSSAARCELGKRLEPQWGRSRQAFGSLPTMGSLGGATFALLGHACARFWEWEAPGAQVGRANPGGRWACLTREWEVESEWVLGATHALCPVHGFCNHLLSIYLLIFFFF